MWKIKDPELKAKINQFFTDEEIDNACKEQVTDPSYNISLSHQPSPSGKKKLIVLIDKDCFGFVPEYNPGAWNPYPKIQPPRSGLYFVYLDDAWEQRLILVEYELINNHKKWRSVPDGAIIAFKECHEEPPTGMEALCR